MSLEIHRQNPYSVYTLLNENIKQQTRVERFKNVLTGRVYQNWREQLFSIGTVYYVIKAALSFFTGHWITCLIELTTSGFMAVMRKEISDFTNLHIATKSYREQNMEFALNNLDLRKGISEFKAEVQSLRQESEKFQSSNEEYAHNNAVHKNLLDTLERTTEELGEEIRTALDQDKDLSKRILNKFLDGVTRIKEEKQLLEGFTGEMRKEHKQNLKQLNRVLQQVSETGDRHIQIAIEVNEDIKASEKTLKKIRNDLSKYEGQAEAIKQEIEHLQEVRRGLQEDEARIRATIGDLEIATKRNLDTSHRVAGVFKSLFFSTTDGGGREVAVDRLTMLLLGLYGAGYVVKNMVN